MLNRICRAIFALVVVSGTGLIVVDEAWAFSSLHWRDEARAVVEQLDEALDEPLPTPAEVLPGYTAPRADAAFLAYSYFAVGPEEPAGLGSLFTQLLVRRLVESTDRALGTPPLYFWSYKWAVNSSSDSHYSPEQDQYPYLERLSARTGATLGLTGRISESAGQLNVYVDLVDLESGQSRVEREYTAEADHLQPLFERIATDVASDVGVSTSNPSALQLEYPSTLNDLRDVARDGTPAIRRLMEEKPFPSAFLWLLEYEGSAQASSAIDHANRMWPEHGLIRFALAEIMPKGEKGNPNRERMRRHIELAAEYPNDINIWINTIQSMAWCCYTREALTLSRELMLRHPEHYFSWLGFIEAVNERAWQLRGNHPWRRVPERGKRQFPKFMSVADSAADRAVMLHDAHPWLWMYKGVTPPGYSSANQDALLTAVELGPELYDPYDRAIRTLGPKWGGSLDIQMRFFDLAVENNPNAQWPFDIYHEAYVDGPDLRVRTAGFVNRLGCGLECRKFASFGGYAALALFAVFFLIVALRRTLL